MMNKLLLLLLLCINLSAITAKESDSLTTHYLALGIGLPHWYFRDKVSSSLAYEGIGLGELNLQKTKFDSNSIRHFNLNISGGLPAPSITDKTAWNESGEIYFYEVGYTYLRRLNLIPDHSLSIYLGARLSSQSHVSIYPTINSNLSYNANWLSIQPTGALVRDFNLKRLKTRLVYQFSISLLSFNARPNSYIGLFPAENIWDQDDRILNALASHIKPTSVHNNLTIQSTIFWDVYTRRNKFRLTYDWLFQNNSVAVNSLTLTKSSIAISYLFNLNRKS